MSPRSRRLLGAVLALTTLSLSATIAAQWDDDENEACDSAKQDAESAAWDLSNSARRLATCASFEDFENDCTIEFRAVQRAHETYEDAVAEFDDVCDT
jgi:hypothetical protein